MGRADDYVALLEVMQLYAHAVDTEDWVQLRACFTEDVVFTDYKDVKIEGRDALVEHLQPILTPFPITHHLFGLPLLKIRDDHAEGVGYAIGTHVLPDTPGGDVCSFGLRYDDEFERTQDGWKISRRHVVPLWTHGNPGIFDRALAA
jgi:ketosteroid isomerase-like protein